MTVSGYAILMFMQMCYNFGDEKYIYKNKRNTQFGVQEQVTIY